MKIFQTFTLILSTATLFLLVACSKQQDTEPTPEPQPAEAPAAAMIFDSSVRVPNDARLTGACGDRRRREAFNEAWVG